MKCVCEHSAKSIIFLNRHRKDCAVFWRSVYAEMERISIMIYGKVVPIAITEWDTCHSEQFPNIKTFRDWGKTWTQVQEESGHGVSPLGRGASVAKGAPAKRPTWDRIAELPDYTAAYSYLDDLMPSNGLAVCTETYQRTGRMILR